MRGLIEETLERRKFAVSGASRSEEKFGYKVYVALKQAGYTVYPVNPNAEEVDGDTCYPTLDNVPDSLECVVTVTPPAVTEETVREAGHLGIPYVWMQPGSESEAAFNTARAASIQIVSGGPCIMAEIGKRAAKLVGR